MSDWSRKELEQRRSITSDDPVELLKKAVVNYNKREAPKAAEQAIRQNIPPTQGLKAMTEAIRFIGDGFDIGELWLPDLVGAAKAMTAASDVLEEEIKRKGEERSALGTVLLGTMAGDIHDIGKTMLGTLLTAEGFRVRDLGTDVSANQFITALQEHQADIIAMSSLLTSSAPQQGKVIQNLEDRGLRDRVKVLVGGAAISQEFAHQIGADGYHPTAPGGAKLATDMMEGVS